MALQQLFKNQSQFDSRALWFVLQFRFASSRIRCRKTWIIYILHIYLFFIQPSQRSGLERNYVLIVVGEVLSSNPGKGISSSKICTILLVYIMCVMMTEIQTTQGCHKRCLLKRGDQNKNKKFQDFLASIIFEHTQDYYFSLHAIPCFGIDHLIKLRART